ncbi:MAG: hypothetical protein QOE83_722 [Actinomycetota bacterium]|nr:hypothetical protein [Actinomycetota bacterium]
MLSDQRSPYVGRFARGWRRLPRNIPGQPQTRTRARSSIGTTPFPRNPSLGPSRHGPSGRRRTQRTPECPRGDHQVHLPCARAHQGPRARGSRCSGREHVVHQQHRRRTPVGRNERAPQGRPTFGAASACLRPGADGSFEEPLYGKVQLASEPPSKHARLVIAARSQPRARQRHPCHRQRITRPGRRSHGGHRPGERRSNVLPARVFQSMHRRPGWTVEPERRSRGGERPIGTITTREGRGRGGPSTPLTPRRLQGGQFRATVVAEGPWPVAAPRAPAREQDVRELHPGSRYGRAPTSLPVGYEGSATSKGSSPLETIFSNRSERSTGYAVTFPLPEPSSNSLSTTGSVLPSADRRRSAGASPA